MASTITAGNATNGLALSCDNTGILELKTGTGSGTTAITADASQNAIFAGNVGIGTSSPSSRLQINQATTGTYFRANASTADRPLMFTSSTTTNNGDTHTIKVDSGTGILAFAIDAAERARIDSSGNLLVGTTTSGSNSNNSVNVEVSSGRWWHSHSSAQTSGSSYSVFQYNGNIIGTITQNGTTAVAYNTTSDYRLKENVQPMTGALAKVAALNPCTYTWKADGSDGEGFIAHELAEVVPGCVTGEKDAVNEDGSIKPQGIDTSFLVATLTAAIQEQQQMIETLQAKVAALEAK